MITVDGILKTLALKLKSVSPNIRSEELSVDFDFNANKVGVYYMVKHLTDGSYKDVIPFEVHIRSKSVNYQDALTVLNAISGINDDWWSDESGNNFWIHFDEPKVLFPNDGTGIKHIILNMRLNTNYENE